MTKKTAIINFVQSKGTVRRKDLINFIVEMNGYTFDPIRHRGYYACALWNGPFAFNSGYLVRPTTNEPRYLTRIDRGLWAVQC